MGKAFDPAWIPKTDRDRHMETKLGRPVSQNIFYRQLVDNISYSRIE